MQPFRDAGFAGRSSGSQAPPRRRWRPLAWAGAVVMAVSLGTAPVAVAAAASTGPPSPAPGIAPGAANVSGTNYVFYTATDGTVQMKSLATGGQYESAGGHLVSAPSPIVTAVGHEGLAAFVVFGEGTDHKLWYTTCTAEGPTVSDCTGSWTSLGGALSSGPAAAYNTDSDNYSVYVRGSDGAVWGRDYNGTGWSAWYRTGGALLAGTGPAAAYDANDYVLVVGTNRQLYIHRAGVTGFTAVGGATNSSPALADTTSGLVGFARGTTNSLWYHQFQQSTPGWHPLGGVLTTGPGGSASGATPYAYALGSDGQVWQHTGLDSGTWSQVTP